MSTDIWHTVVMHAMTAVLTVGLNRDAVSGTRVSKLPELGWRRRQRLAMFSTVRTTVGSAALMQRWKLTSDPVFMLT